MTCPGIRPNWNSAPEGLTESALGLKMNIGIPFLANDYDEFNYRMLAPMNSQSHPLKRKKQAKITINLKRWK
jgi:hypothetical protein